MSDDTPLSILDERPPPRGLNFNQKVMVAALLLVVLPALLSCLVIMLMILTGGPR